MIVAMFPGQGSQAVGMGRGLAEAFPVARRTFEEADDVLGYALSAICFEGPAERLTETDVCQPALVATSTAAYRVAREEVRRGREIGHDPRKRSPTAGHWYPRLQGPVHGPRPTSRGRSEWPLPMW